MCDGMEDEFDPFVYRGDMSVEDFRRAQDNYFEDKQDDREEDEDEGYEV
jgi:hypothetical protein